MEQPWDDGDCHQGAYGRRDDLSHGKVLWTYVQLALSFVLVLTGVTGLALWACRGKLRRMLRDLASVEPRKTDSVMNISDSKMRDLVDERHRDFWRLAFRGGGVVACAIMMLILARILLQAQISPTVEDAIMEVALDPRMEVLLDSTLHIGFFSLVFSIFPCLLTKRSLHAFLMLSHIQLSGHMLMNSAFMQNSPMHKGILAEQFTAAQGRNAMARVVLGLNCPSVTFVLLTNLTSSILNGYLAREVQLHLCGDMLPTILLEEGLVLGLIIAVCLTSRHLLFTQVKSTLVAKVSGNFVSTMETILYGVCDAVVQVNEDLSLKTPSRELDAMLLNTRPACAEGMRHNFLNLVASEDRSKLTTFLEPTMASGHRLPGSVHVTLKDLNCTQVPVQIFHGRCQDAMDNVFHILGIREATEEQWSPGPMGMGMERTQSPVGLCEIGDSFEEESSSESNVPRRVLTAAEPREYVLHGEVSVWIDPNDPGLPMRRWTPEFFTMTSGLVSEGAQLLAWTPERHREELKQRIQEVTFELVSFPGARRLEIQFRQPGRAKWSERTLAVSASLDDEAGVAVGSLSADRALPLVKLHCRQRGGTLSRAQGADRRVKL